MVGRQFEEIAVAIVERAARTDAGHQDPVGMIQPGPRQRQQDGGVGGLIVRPPGATAAPGSSRSDDDRA